MLFFLLLLLHCLFSTARTFFWALQVYFLMCGFFGLCSETFVYLHFFCNCHLLFASDNGPFFIALFFSLVPLKIIGRNWKTWMNFMFTTNCKSPTWIAVFFSSTRRCKIYTLFSTKLKFQFDYFILNMALLQMWRYFACAHLGQLFVINKI